MDPLGQFMAAGRPNLVLGHQMPASNALGQPSYTTVTKTQSWVGEYWLECYFEFHFIHHVTFSIRVFDLRLLHTTNPLHLM